MRARALLPDFLFRTVRRVLGSSLEDPAFLAVFVSRLCCGACAVALMRAARGGMGLVYD